MEEVIDEERFVIEEFGEPSELSLESSFDSVPANVSLLACSNHYGYYVAGSNEGIIAGFTKSLRNDFVNGRGTISEKQVIPIPKPTRHVSISGDELRILAVTEGGYIAVFHAPNIIESKEPSKWIELGENVVDIKPNPDAGSSLAAVVLSSNTCKYVDFDSGEIVANLDSGVTAICWSPKGKQIACGKSDGSVDFFDIQGVKKATLEASATRRGNQVQNIVWIETNVFLITYRDTKDDFTEYVPVIVNRKAPTDAEKYTELFTVCVTSADPANYFYAQLIRNLDAHVSNMVLLGSVDSINIDGIGQGSDGAWMNWNGDGSVCSLPLTEDFDDRFPRGIAMDYSADSPDFPDDAPGRMPIMFILDNFGNIHAKRCTSVTLQKVPEDYSGLYKAVEFGAQPQVAAAMGAPPTPTQPTAAAAAATTAATVQDTPPAEKAANPFIAAQSSTTSFASLASSKPGSGAPAGGGFMKSASPFGSTSFGSTSFGAPSFGSPSFGASSFGAAPTGQSTFGNTSTTAAAGSAFGKPSFGSAASFGTSSFGSSTADAFGTGQSGSSFASLAQGAAQPKESSAPVATGFGAATSTPSIPPAAPASTLTSTPAPAPSPFGQLAASKPAATSAVPPSAPPSFASFSAPVSTPSTAPAAAVTTPPATEKVTDLFSAASITATPTSSESIPSFGSLSLGGSKNEPSETESVTPTALPSLTETKPSSTFPFGAAVTPAQAPAQAPALSAPPAEKKPESKPASVPSFAAMATPTASVAPTETPQKPKTAVEKPASPERVKEEGMAKEFESIYFDISDKLAAVSKLQEELQAELNIQEKPVGTGVSLQNASDLEHTALRYANTLAMIAKDLTGLVENIQPDMKEMTESASRLEKTSAEFQLQQDAIEELLKELENINGSGIVRIERHLDDETQKQWTKVKVQTEHVEALLQDLRSKIFELKKRQTTRKEIPTEILSLYALRRGIRDIEKKIIAKDNDLSMMEDRLAKLQIEDDDSLSLSPKPKDTIVTQHSSAVEIRYTANYLKRVRLGELISLNIGKQQGSLSF